MVDLHIRQFSSHNHLDPTTFLTIAIATPTPTPTPFIFHAQATSSPTSTQAAFPHTSSTSNDNKSWGMGNKLIASFLPVVIIALLILACWYRCCSPRAKRRAARRAHPIQQERELYHRDRDDLPIPLMPVPAAHLAPGDGGEEGLPRYAKALPPSHVMIARGPERDGVVEEVVADGKTPLSERWDDVVLVEGRGSESESEGSRRNFTDAPPYDR